jgi:hypothetical protein
VFNNQLQLFNWTASTTQTTTNQARSNNRSSKTMRRIPLPQLMGMRQPPMSTTTLLIVILGFVMDLLLLLTTTMLIAAILVMNTGRNANGDEAAKNPPQPQQPQNKPEVQTDTCGLGGHLLNEDGTAVTLAEGPTTTQALLVM